MKMSSGDISHTFFLAHSFLRTFVLLLLITWPLASNSLKSSGDVISLPLPGQEEFHEELYLQTLSDGFINTHFQFSTRWRYGQKDNLYNTRLVSRSIAELLLEYDVTELHVSLTHGLWKYQSWGYPVVDAMPGAEIWAWFSAKEPSSSLGQNSSNVHRSVDEQWIKLTSILSGILCASLNFVDGSNTITPQHTFRPQFLSDGGGKKNHQRRQQHHVRYAALPREIVCTENLTPWKKLLPCNSHSGLVSLLNSRHVYHSNYHSMGLQMRTLCVADNDCTLEFLQTANLVFDPHLISSNRGVHDFSLRRLFGQGLNGDCPLAKSSRIYVNHNVFEMYTMNPMPTFNVSSNRAGYTSIYGVYDLKRLKNSDDEQKEQESSQQKDKGQQTQTEVVVSKPVTGNGGGGGGGPARLFNIAWMQRKLESGRANWRRSKPQQPPILVHRYILGRGQERGELITQITNNQHRSLPIILMENLPWFMPIYLHTLRLTTATSPTTPENGEIKPISIHYRPGWQRKRPYHLELLFKIPARSTVKVRCDFDYIFLKWLEYPPDANHGHHISSAIITTQLTDLAMNYSALPLYGYRFVDTFNASTNADNEYLLRLHTETLILSLPTPDFSMPYNAICLACTVVALAFGPIHSATTKRIIIERSSKDNNSNDSKDGNGDGNGEQKGLHTSPMNEKNASFLRRVYLRLRNRHIRRVKGGGDDVRKADVPHTTTTTTTTTTLYNPQKFLSNVEDTTPESLAEMKKDSF